MIINTQKRHSIVTQNSPMRHTQIRQQILLEDGIRIISCEGSISSVSHIRRSLAGATRGEMLCATARAMRYNSHRISFRDSSMVDCPISLIRSSVYLLSPSTGSMSILQRENLLKFVCEQKHHSLGIFKIISHYYLQVLKKTRQC